MASQGLDQASRGLDQASLGLDQASLGLDQASLSLDQASLGLNWATWAWLRPPLVGLRTGCDRCTNRQVENKKIPHVGMYRSSTPTGSVPKN